MERALTILVMLVSLAGGVGSFILMLFKSKINEKLIMQLQTTHIQSLKEALSEVERTAHGIGLKLDKDREENRKEHKSMGDDITEVKTEYRFMKEQLDKLDKKVYNGFQK